MKLLFIIIILLLSKFSFAQDSTFRCDGGNVEVKRLGIGKIHSVEGKRYNQVWISGKVKRVDYEYTYTRTFNGSTQPANPKEFYKPIKAKSFYFVPIEDIIIKYGNGRVFQTLSIDSLILRSYLEDGTPRDIYYLNSDLQADSIFRFYENGNLKTKIIGVSDQLKENLALSINRYQYPEMILRIPPLEWLPDYNATRYMPFRSNYSESNTPCYPKKQYYCHGNGKPQIVISTYPDSLDANTYHKEYEFFDPQGNTLDSNRISDRGSWSGVKYSYYKSGVLESITNLCEDRFCGKNEYWNHDGTRKHIEYRNEFKRDSIVFFQQLKDTLFIWRPPMHFVWNQNNAIKEVIHKHCKLEFKHDGSLHYYGFEGTGGYTSEKDNDKRMQLEHFGTKDELGLPHGKWLGVNKFNDTIYEVNFHHGWLHGLYKINSSYWPSNWIRNYNMGFEIDSSVRMYNGKIHDIDYFSEPGKLVKKAVFNGDGRLSYIDTTLNGTKFIRLRQLHFDGWDMEVSKVDSTIKQIYTKRFFAKDSLEMEQWTAYSGNILEKKEYHHKTGSLKTHWKYHGLKDSDGKFYKPGEIPTTKLPLVKLTTQWNYDEKGILIKKEVMENGIVVE